MFSNWKLKLTIIFLCCLSSNCENDIYSKFHQKDYKVLLQRIVLVSYNKSVFNFWDIKTFKYNRTMTAINATVNSKITMSTELEVVVQAYKFLSNEYRILSGTRFLVNFCKSLKADLGGMQSLYRCGNFTSCQIMQETTYVICNFYPDESRFPPFMPTGEYKIQMETLYNEETVLTVDMFIKIFRPVAIPSRKRVQ